MASLEESSENLCHPIFDVVEEIVDTDNGHSCDLPVFHAMDESNIKHNVEQALLEEPMVFEDLCTSQEIRAITNIYWGLEDVLTPPEKAVPCMPVAPVTNDTAE